MTDLHSAGGTRLNQFYTVHLCLQACRDLLDNCVGVDIDSRLHDEIRCWVHTNISDFDETYHSVGLTQYRLVRSCAQPGNTLRSSDVNKDLGLKAKAKAKDLGPKAKAKDSRYQGQIFHRSSPYSIHHFFMVNVVRVTTCSRTIPRVNYILSAYEQMDMLLLLMTIIDNEEWQTESRPRHRPRERPRTTFKAKPKAKDLDPKAKAKTKDLSHNVNDLGFGLKDQGKGQGLTSLLRSWQFCFL